MASERTTALVVAALLLGGFTGGCGTSAAPTRVPRSNASLPSGRAPASGGAVGAIPRLDNSLHQVLPVESYLISPQQYGEIESAESVLVASCMKRFGFNYTPPTPDFTKKSNQTAHRYDPTDPRQAAVRGYHGSVEVQGNEAKPAREPTADMQRVLGYGVGAPAMPGIPVPKPGDRYRGIPIPDGGCMGEADQRLSSHGGIVSDDKAAENVNFNNYARSMTDPKVKSVFAKWSACMRDKGYRYPTPRAAGNDPRWHTSTPSTQERATAVADVRCKQRYNIVGVWFTVESGDEIQDIRANPRHFARVRTAIKTASLNAEAIIHSAGSIS